MTNIEGEIVETFDYGPYGELLSENNCGIMFLYNGELGVATDSNGLYYMRARYYNPEIKRFINQDVMTGSITDTPTLNRYAYVNGNPISLNDPFGLSPMLNWGFGGHLVLSALSFLTIIPTPWTYAIGSGASIINALWYASEENTFLAVCNAIPVFGGGYSLLLNCGTNNALLQILKFSTAGLSVGTGGYDIYQVGKENYQQYAIEGQDFSLSDTLLDTGRILFDSVAIAGGIKLFQTHKTSNPAASAGEWQGSDDYPGVDNWENVTLNKGTVVWGGEPGQSNFYTTDDVMAMVGNDATKLNQGLQVGRGAYPTYRAGMTKYIVNQDIIAGYSKALANPAYGAGGFDQYFIENFQDVLDPIFTLLMTNR